MLLYIYEYILDLVRWGFLERVSYFPSSKLKFPQDVLRTVKCKQIPSYHHPHLLYYILSTLYYILYTIYYILYTIYYLLSTINYIRNTITIFSILYTISQIQIFLLQYILYLYIVLLSLTSWQYNRLTSYPAETRMMSNCHLSYL